KILKVLSDKRRGGQLVDLQPDAKSQVTVKYVNGSPVGCTKVVVSTQHHEATRNGQKYTPEMVREMIVDTVKSALPDGWMPKAASDQHPPQPEAQPADLPPHRGLRPFRARARQRGRLLLGEDRSRRCARARAAVSLTSAPFSDGAKATG